MVTNLAEDRVCFHHCVIHQNSCTMVVTEQCRAAKGVSNLGHLYITNFSDTKRLWQLSPPGEHHPELVQPWSFTMQS